MALTAEHAYLQIKQLEQAGRLQLPTTEETVQVGTIDAATGEFTFNVETLTQTYKLPDVDDEPPDLPPTFPPPVMFAARGAGSTSIGDGQDDRPRLPLTITVGLVHTAAVKLKLRFAVARAAAPSSPTSIHVVFDEVNTVATAESPSGPDVAVESAFPVVAGNAAEIVVDAGMTASKTLKSRYVTPGIEVFALSVVKGTRRQSVHIAILRPPVLGFGAFTIPALPITIIYAPPQGRQARNSATFSDVTTVSRTLISSVKTDDSTRTVEAYSNAELVSKAAGAIQQVVEVAGILAAPAGAAVIGSMKDLTREFNLFSTIMGGLSEHMSTTDSTTLTSQSDHSMMVTSSNSSMFGSQASLGPGVGDRFVYMSDVRVVWMALDGKVGIHVLGFQAVKAITAQGLLQDKAALASGGSATISGLDADSLDNLIRLNPFCVRRNPVALTQPPPVGPPRFMAATPPGQAGVGTGSAGDQIAISYSITTEDKTVSTRVDTNIQDMKPGWLSVLLGAENESVTSTFTYTVSHSDATRVDDKISYSATFFSEGPDDPYDVLIFYDRLFGSMLFAPRGSPVLQGTGGIAISQPDQPVMG